MPLPYAVLSPKPFQETVIACGDNLAFLRGLTSHSMKLIVTSPPYNLGKAYEKTITWEIYLKQQQQVIQECMRLLHDTGSLCWQVGNFVQQGEVFPLDMLLYPCFKAFGLQLRNRIIWYFGHGLHCKKRLSGRYETILWFTKTEHYTFNLDAIRVPAKYPNKKHFKGPKRGQYSGHPLGKNPSDVWEIPNVKANHVEKTAHPCQFPVELIERLVLALTNTGDSVLDPYLGSGSTVIAAIKHQRKGYGCDNMPAYVEIAQQRIQQFQSGTLKLRERGKAIYDPLR